MPAKSNNGCMLIDRFSLKEKLFLRTTWFGFLAVGTHAIYKQDPLWAWIYVVYTILGFALLVLPGMCAHCPYPYQFSTCLFIPPSLLRKFYTYRGPRMSPTDKAVALSAMAGMVLLPNFWLIHDIRLAVLFWLLALPSLVIFPMHYCPRCRHFGCPLNKAKKS
jgi:hypothetical protein